ncbi:MAG: hypothetical protein AB4080_21870 [Trichodesmium sp.]
MKLTITLYAIVESSESGKTHLRATDISISRYRELLSTNQQKLIY